MKLSDAQIKMLTRHVGTTMAKPRWPKMGLGVSYEDRQVISLFNPTASALERAGLMTYRGYDGKTRGGWFITRKGTHALHRALQPSQ